MIFKPFIEFFPGIAEKETRRITLRNDPIIPDGEYAFLDCFCEDKDCDCRLVYFFVLQIDPDYEPIYAATISYGWEDLNSYGWEDLNFYLFWSPYTTMKMATTMKGPILQTSQRQSPYAEPFLELFESKFLIDSSYIDRIRRHYTLFKDSQRWLIL